MVPMKSIVTIALFFTKDRSQWKKRGKKIEKVTFEKSTKPREYGHQCAKKKVGRINEFFFFTRKCMAVLPGDQKKWL